MGVLIVLGLLICSVAIIQLVKHGKKEIVELQVTSNLKQEKKS